MSGDNFINILSDEKTDECAHDFITEDFLKNYINGNVKYVYLCGPPQMMKALTKQLKNLDVNKKSIIEETF